MRIGIIGTGNMGRALGLRWARGGHDVLFGSQELSKAETVAASGPDSAQVGDFDAAAAFGDVVLYTVRDVFPSSLLRKPQALAGKIVIDCNNSAILGLDIPDPKHRPGVHFTMPIPSLAERLAADAQGARVVKAFNTIPSKIIELDWEKLVPHRVSVFLCSDDPQAKSVVSGLAEELGFVSVDSGELERAQLVEAVADFIRFQILSMGLGPFATISVHLVPNASEEPSSIKDESSMRTLQAVRHISVSINRPPDQVYDFVSNPENLPKWATGLGEALKNVNGEWIADAPMGKVKIRFAKRNAFGVLDHDVILESGAKIHNPMRVVPNGGGSEIVFTLLRQPDMSDEKFSEDAKWVEKDLIILKDLLEK